MMQEKPYQTIAESLLGRSLTDQDGVDASIFATVESKLCQPIVTELKIFYEFVGNLPQFMSAFQLFALPEQLYFKDDVLIFLEENQGTCFWGVNKQLSVIQFDEDGACYELGFDIAAFLKLMLYYQVAQGAEFSYCSNLLDQELEELYQEKGWQQVVNYDDLIIYQLSHYLIWYFKDEDGDVLDDQIYFVSLLEIPTEIINQYVLEEL